MGAKTPAILLWMDRQLGCLTGLFALAGALAVLGLMAITVVGVIARYGFNDPIFGIEDLSVVTLTIAAAAAVAYGGRTSAHVSVNVISLLVGRRVTRITDLVMRCLTVAVCALAVYGLITKACGLEKACVTSNFSIEHWPFYYVLAVAMALYGLNVALQLAVGLWHWSGSDPNEAAD